MVVNETVANGYWPGGNPVGDCVLIRRDSSCTTIVGVIQDVLLFDMVGEVRGQNYVPLTHPVMETSAPGALLVRTHGDAARTAGPLRRELQLLAPGMPYVSVDSFEELVAPELQPWRLGATMFTVFGVLALVIAAVGLYSVLAYAVSQRTQEIGVRMALGAGQADVVRIVVRDGVAVAAAGTVLGILLALAAGRFIAPLLYETSARDPEVFGIVAATMLVVAVAASLIPAWRAARVDPSVALRAE